MKERIKSNSNPIIVKMFIGLILVMTFNDLVMTVVGLTDGLCISRLIGADGAAAHSATSPISQIIAAITSFISVGLQVIITKLLSKGKKEEANSIFSLTLSISLIFCISLFFLGFFGSDLIADFIGASKASEAVGIASSSYIKGIIIGLPFILLNQILMPIVYLDGDKVTPKISIALTLFINVGLDILFAMFFKDKMFGVGFASSLSYIIAAIPLLAHFVMKKSNIKFTFKGWRNAKFGLVLLSGIPVLIKNLIITLRVFSLNYIILDIGGNYTTQIMTIRSCQMTFDNMFVATCSGLITTSLLLSGIFYGEENETDLNHLFNLTLKYLLIVGGTFTIIFFFSSKYLAILYGIKDAEMLKYADFSMKVNAIALMFSAFNISMLGALQGTKRIVLASIATTFQSFICPIISIILFAKTYYDPVKGLFIGESFGFVLYAAFYFIAAWIYSKHIPYKGKHFYFLPKTFGYKKEDMIEFNITSIKDTMDLQQRVLVFCNEHKIDERRKQNLAACIEELGVMIVTSGFLTDKKKHNVSMRILYKNNDLILRTRDDCDKFNIELKDEKIRSEEDKTHNMAIRIIIRLSKSIDYIPVLKTNNLIIKL